MRPVRRKKPAKKKSGKKAARKKTARGRVTKKAARRVKKVVRRAAKREAAPKRKTAAKLKLASKRKTATRKRASKRSASARAAQPKLAMVPRPRPPKPPKPALPKPATEPRAFAAAKVNASAKDLVLFELVRAHVAVAAAIQGMSPGSAEVPTEPGKWSTREMILHLAYWDREMLSALEDAYQHGKAPGLTRDDIERRNPVGIEELAHHDWDSARRLLQLHREKLMEEFQSIPEEPAEVWSKEHPVGKLARILTHHDRHHADKLKAARTSRGE